jgi:putative ABC transport system permease protein
MKFFPLIWANLKRRKLRTTLTMLSIFVAFLLFGLLCAIRHALSGGVEFTNASRLIVRHKISLIQPLPRSYKERMLKIPGVVAAVHQTWFNGYYQEEKNLFMETPVEPQEFLEMHPEIVLPEDQKQAWFKTRTGAIIGKKTVQRFGWKIGDRVPLQTPIYARTDGSHTWEFDIVGIYDTNKKGTDTTPLFFRYDYFDEARNPRSKGQVGWYTIRVGDPKDAEKIAQLVDKEFENSDAETKTEPEGAFAQSFASQVGNIALITAAIMSAVFLIILLVAGNTMSESVRERSGELGVLKALGFTNAQVVIFVLTESCLLAILAAALGLFIGWALVTAIGDPTGGMLPMFYFPVKNLFLGLGIAIALGLITGLFPALNTTRLRIADSLRRM